MACKKCVENPVIQLPNSNVNLCKNCFIKYFEKKVNKTIGEYDLIDKKDHIVVACSGGKDSTVLLYLLKKLTEKRKDVKITALAIDEGIKGYRDKSLDFLTNFCKEHKVELNIFSYEKEFGKPLDEILKSYNGVPCSICGVFRRYLLNKKSKELNGNKLATGHNLDDESQSIIMNYFRKNIKLSARLGPITGIIADKRFIRRIKPLYFLTEKEITSYAFLKGFMDKFTECPHDADSYRAQIRDMLNNFEAKYPGTKHSIITSFLEILPVLKEKYKDEQEIKSCKICDEPCSQEICKACQYAEEVVKNFTR
ncbi:TIGR00269 family protein [Candidatus Woesearchaeota archaeon]|nr:TIGR00269 family protein [Candidatus Woesearchaeota archaeon]